MWQCRIDGLVMQINVMHFLVIKYFQIMCTKKTIKVMYKQKLVSTKNEERIHLTFYLIFSCSIMQRLFKQIHIEPRLFQILLLLMLLSLHRFSLPRHLYLTICLGQHLSEIECLSANCQFDHVSLLLTVANKDWLIDWSFNLYSIYKHVLILFFYFYNDTNKNKFLNTDESIAYKCMSLYHDGWSALPQLLFLRYILLHFFLQFHPTYHWHLLS